MPLVRSAIRRASRKGRGFDTPCGGMVEHRPQRVAMPGRRDGRHASFSSLPATPHAFARGTCLLLIYDALHVAHAPTDGQPCTHVRACRMGRRGVSRE